MPLIDHMAPVKVVSGHMLGFVHAKNLDEPASAPKLDLQDLQDLKADVPRSVPAFARPFDRSRSRHVVLQPGLPAHHRPSQSAPQHEGPAQRPFYDTDSISLGLSSVPA